MISFNGLASGLNTGAIIDSLLSLERIPILQYEARKSVAQSKLSLMGTFKGHVKALQDKADALRSESNFLQFKVSLSQDNIANVTASGDAILGSHTLEVLSLATADVWAFDGLTDPDADLASTGSENITFDVNGTSYSYTADPSNSSLNDLASGINALAGDDVNASVVNVGTESSPSYQLVIASRSTGEDARIANLKSTLTGLPTVDPAGPDGNGDPQSANNVSAGNNAVAVVDGLTIQRSTNEFDDVIGGLSITVLGKTSQPISIGVEGDSEETKKSIQELLDAYNKVIDFINDQNTFTAGDGDDLGAVGGDLFGENILRDVRSRINNALFNVSLTTVQNDTAGFSTLGLIGIESDQDGRLTLNDSKFDAKFAEDPDAVMDLFVDTDGFDNAGAVENTIEYYTDTTADSGLADKLHREIERMFDTFTSGEMTFKNIFDTRTDTFNDTIKRLDKQIERKEEFIDRFEQQLIQRYSRFEQLIGSLNAQGASLSAFFG